MRVHTEARIASLLAAGGVIWAVNIATTNFTTLPAIVFPPGPLETCAIGILIWLHAKWRGSVGVR